MPIFIGEPRSELQWLSLIAAKTAWILNVYLT